MVWVPLLVMLAASQTPAVGDAAGAACPEYGPSSIPPTVAGYTERGLSYIRMQQFDCAASAFREALKQEPDSAPALYQLALVFSAGKRYVAAASLLNRVIGLRISYNMQRQARLTLAEVLNASGKTAEAITALSPLLNEAPHDPSLHLSLANAYALDHRYDAAAEEYRRVLQIEPNNATALLSIGKVLTAGKSSDQAIPFLETYVRNNPGDWEGHYVAGRTYLATGKTTGAIRELQTASRIKPRDYEVRYYLSKALAAAGDAAGELDELEAARGLNPDAEEVLYALARALETGGNKPAAAEAFAALKARQQRRQHKDAAVNEEKLGSRALAAGDARAAAEFFRKAIELTPDEGRDHYNLALALARLGDRTAAYRELAKATELDPGLAAAYNQLGLMEMAEDRLAKAEAAFRRALNADPQFAEAKNNLGVLFARSGRTAQAKHLFEAATEDNPSYPDAYLNWGLTLAGEGSYLEAKTRLKRALELAPGLKQASAALHAIDVHNQ